MQQYRVNINILQYNVRCARYNGHVTALYSRCILNKRAVERVCAFFNQPLFEGGPNLGSSFAARRGNDSISKLVMSSGFLKPHSYDAVIARTLKSFWYV